MGNNTDKQIPKQILFQYKKFKFERRQFEFVFYRDGSSRDIWWSVDGGQLVSSFLTALKNLPYKWGVEERSEYGREGHGQLSPEEYTALYFEGDALTTRVKLSDEIEAKAAIDPRSDEALVWIDPNEITPGNCRHVFEFIRNIGHEMSTDVLLGSDGGRDPSFPPKFQVRWAKIAYDADTDELY